VRRKRSRTVAGMAAALLLGLTLAGCGKHGATPQPTTQPPVPQASSSPAALGSTLPSTSPVAAPSTPDAVASELDQINQLIDDIGDSVQSSDSSQQGGE
jgi:predicted small lipoprotein YifL